MGSREYINMFKCKYTTEVKQATCEALLVGCWCHSCVNDWLGALPIKQGPIVLCALSPFFLIPFSLLSACMQISYTTLLHIWSTLYDLNGLAWQWHRPVGWMLGCRSLRLNTRPESRTTAVSTSLWHQRWRLAKCDTGCWLGLELRRLRLLAIAAWTWTN